MSIQRCSPRSPQPADDFSAQAALLKALADPHRLSILATLAAAQGEVCVCEFTESLPLNQPTVSHHLRILREAELVTCERRGTWVYYELAGDVLKRVRAALTTIFDQKVPA